MSDVALEQIIPDIENLNDGPLYRGYLEKFENGAVTGWCIAAGNPVAPVKLNIYLCGILIGTTSTTVFRPDISDALGFPVKAGFRFSLKNAEDRDLQEVRKKAIKKNNLSKNTDFIEVKISETGYFLMKSPQLFFPADLLDLKTTPAARVTADLAEKNHPGHRGIVDSCCNGQITGWCLNTERLNSPVELDIYLFGFLIGTTTTDIPRPDIGKVLREPVNAGFSFSLSECASAVLDQAKEALTRLKAHPEDAPGAFVVRIRESGQELSNSPAFSISVADLDTVIISLDRRSYDLQQNTAIRQRESLMNAAPLMLNAASQNDVKLVAFYLPQFHPLVENNEWWGEGFTEWTNVTTAKPSFLNHYQPRIPADLGYYDLRLDEVHKQQVKIAKQYGVSGFCYHYYWFSGTTLMTLPIDRHMEQDYDLDFCLCWANENWSRRWDGSEADILMAQQHSELDDVSFIYSVLPYFKHSRYIKINGAPLLIIYRLSLLSNPPHVIEQWRKIARDAGFPDLHVTMAETFGLEDPYEYGANSTCQFPPHGVVAQEKTSEVDDLAVDFSGKVYDYQEVVAGELKRPDPGHIRFRTVMPSWDNTSRKGRAGHVFHNASPDMFEAWLSCVMAKTRRENPEGYRYVFINAWNEWAEGAYLEPDRRHGHAYLHAVRNAHSMQSALLGEALLPGPPLDIEDFKSQVLRVVTSLSNANAQMLKLLKEYTHPSEPPSAFIKLMGGMIERFLQPPDARLQIDRINGRPMHNIPVTLLRQQYVKIIGWLRVSGISQTSQKPMYIQLTPVQGSSENSSFLASVYDRSLRPDVGAACDDEDPNQWYGFTLHGDISGVEPGSYRVSALVPALNALQAVYVVDSEIVLHIG